MGDKSFRDRIEEEIQSFSSVYRSFAADRENYLENYKGQEGILNEWYYAFDVPFEKSIKNRLKENPEEEEDFKSRHDAVVEAIRRLGLDELHLGGMTSNGSLPFLTASHLGILRTEDLLHLSGEDQKSLGIRLDTPDRGDPVFWRALLEVFCRAYIASSGRPGWSLLRMIDLAFDLEEIRTEHLDGQKWNAKKALDRLRNKEPYSELHPVLLTPA